MTQNVINDGNLADKTVFLRVRFGVPGNTKKVKEKIIQTDADQKLLSLSKKLLDSKELAEITKSDSEIRKYINSKCLPYDLGTYLLPHGMVNVVAARLKEYKDERDKLVVTFLDNYDYRVNQAKSELGSLYHFTDYLSSEAVETKFYFDWSFLNFGVPVSLESLNPDLYEQELQKKQQLMQQANEEITILRRQMLLDMVSHLKERLEPSIDGKAKKLHETAVTGIQEYLNDFDLMNVTDDTELAKVVQQVKGILTGVSADGIRNSEIFKSNLLSQVASVSQVLGTMVENKPSRKFKDIEE